MRIRRLLVLSAVPLPDALQASLRDQQCELAAAQNPRELHQIIETSRFFDLVLLDMETAGPALGALVSAVQQRVKRALIAGIAGPDGLGQAEMFLRLGGMDVIAKPLSEPQLKALFLKALRIRLLLDQNDYYTHAMPESSQEIIGRSENIRQVFTAIDKAAGAASAILLSGETGTGKSLFARLIHRRAPAPSGPFVQVDCTAYHGFLLEKQLFGNDDAARPAEQRPGCLELAAGGTLVLDEIGAMQLELQEKLAAALKLLDSHTDEAHLPKRIICLTRHNLHARVREGAFSEALHERLSKSEIALPPLRERPGDITLLAEYFGRRFAAELGRPKPALDADVRQTLEAYAWSGNVRELKSWIERASYFASGVINLAALSPQIAAAAAAQPESAAAPSVPPPAPPCSFSEAVPQPPVLAGPDDVLFRVGQPLDEVEKRVISQTMLALRGNRTKAAQMLGISVRTLYSKLLEIESDQKIKAVLGGNSGVGSDEPERS